MKRILVVDDDPAVRWSLNEVLRNQGYDVVAAGDGKQALRLVAVESFDLVITDIFMPEKDGLEIILELHQARPNLKIIAMSGGGVTEAELSLWAAFDFGALLTLAKPFSMQEMIAAVDSVFSKH